MPMYRFRSRNNQEMQELDTPRAGVWIDIENLQEEQVGELVERHGLDDGLLHDARDFFEAPRFEYEDGVVYFFTRYPTQIDGEMSTAPIMIAVGKDFLLTVVHKRPAFLESLAKSADVFTTQKTKLFLQIAGRIANKYTRSITTIRRDVRRQRMEVRKVSEKTIEASVHAEYTLNEFVSALVPTNIALARALASKHFPLFEEDEELLEDVQLENSQVIETAQSTLKTIQNVRNAHATLVSNRLSQVVKTLTALTILLTIPTIISSLYGMNVALPLGDHPFAFHMIVIATVVAMGAVVLFFVRNKWL